MLVIYGLMRSTAASRWPRSKWTLAPTASRSKAPRTTSCTRAIPKLTVRGSGFNNTISLNTLKWGNSLRGKGVNYTITKASGSALTLSLKPGSVWRSNPANLPGPLKLLAVNAGVGLVPVGPTEAKKGKHSRDDLRGPAITANPQQTVYQTHTHELWVTGRWFTTRALWVPN